ncbi:hypothetical protein AXF42_Ash021448 [Apostasia shenzhenica]|uniref:Uncharacterized protein n=1 Tax=Apostasia shenzhenica TaxID=1088818 RepID=A0A2H9ZZJ5_9ASPA|nr:hypothetical protein AXF42_Ash021448 [Apostasia shenzhenica]
MMLAFSSWFRRSKRRRRRRCCCKPSSPRKKALVGGLFSPGEAGAVKEGPKTASFGDFLTMGQRKGRIRRREWPGEQSPTGRALA